MTNYYAKDKPMAPYVRTTIEMPAVIGMIKNTAATAEQKRMAYIMFRNEGANGRSGINNNYCGFQADSGRWDEKFTPLINGVVSKIENGTGRTRLFLAFDSAAGCIAMLTDRVADRGLYIGGKTHKVGTWDVTTVDELCLVYYREWVTGSPTSVPPSAFISNFTSMYKQAEKLFV